MFVFICLFSSFYFFLCFFLCFFSLFFFVFFFFLWSLQVCGDATVCSPETAFTAPPAPGGLPAGQTTLNFLAFGDMGNTGICGAQQHSWDYDNHGERG